MYLVAGVVCLAEHCIWNGDYLVVASVDVDSAHLVIHSHNLIICRVETNTLPAWVSASGEEFLINLLTDDAHLASLAYVHLIEESTVVHYRGSDIGIVVAHSRHIG